MIFDYVTINGVVAFLLLSKRFVTCFVIKKSPRKHFPRNVLNSYQECMRLKWFLLVSEFLRVRQIEIRFLKGGRVILVLNWSGVSDNRRFEKLVVKITVTDRSKSKGKRPLVLKIGGFEKSMIPLAIYFLPDVFYYFQWKPGVLCTEWLAGG